MSLTQDHINHDMRRVAFEQNHLAFRSLNQQMWQIPLISMTLTGGLWFGVSKVEDFPLFRIALLFLATTGNAALFIVILRLRFVMQQYLDWLESNYPDGFVFTNGNRWFNKPFVVRTSFQGMLLLASILSLCLLGVTSYQYYKERSTGMSEDRALAYYQEHAVHLADGYEALTFESAHPSLATYLRTERSGERLRVLDIGAGTGRDAAWLAQLGHEVVAVEPSKAMRTIAERLHRGSAITWVNDRLPEIQVISNNVTRYDLIVVSAVWMHLPQSERKPALQNIMHLLTDNGTLYLTLRLGPEEPGRGIFKVSLQDFRVTAESLGLELQQLDSQSDLLGRPHIRWQALRIDRPSDWRK